MIAELKQLLNKARDQKPTVAALSCRDIVRRTLAAIFDHAREAMPEKASLLELMANPVITSFVDNPQLLRELDKVRTIAANAEHERSVKKRQAALACETCEALLETAEAKFGGRTPNLKPHSLTEAETRQLYIDAYLEEAKWHVCDQKGAVLPSTAGIEIPVEGFPSNSGIGVCDYVLYGRDLLPLAIVEAKKADVEPERGRQQVKLYGDCMKVKYGYVPILYYTNGYEIWCNDGFYPSRQVRAFHTQDELERLIQKRNRRPLDGVNKKINPEIAGRDYQITAVTTLCEKFSNRKRAGLLVMATGTGKTRTVISLIDVLSRENWITNVLFLADRTSLVKQAHDAFKDHLPDYPRCVVSDSELEGSGSESARIVLSTYQTMINKIDGADKLFTSGRFDLIIVDEAHRSIFNKYSAIFDYFDALLVGLTATPRGEVDRNTFCRFGCENDIPDFDYPMEQGFKEKVLVPYSVVTRTSEIVSRGITYALRPREERRQLEEQFNDEPPDKIEAGRIFRSVYNVDTVDKVIRDVFERAIYVDGGERIGKTVFFAYNHLHAELIKQRVDAIAPHPDEWCQVVDNHVKKADALVLAFKTNDNFRIAISVDMLDTGVDVPEILNLVFFKPVRSNIKFTQMVGRGTRLCENLLAPGKNKREFRIFDYCGNFKYFGEHPKEVDPSKSLSLTQRIFATKVEVLGQMQKAKNLLTKFDKDYRASLIESLRKDVLTVKANASRLAVRENLRYIDAFVEPKSWETLSEVQQRQLVRYVAPLIETDETTHVLTKSFDARMLRVELDVLKNGDLTDKSKRDIAALTQTAQVLLDEKMGIQEVASQQSEIETFVDPIYWNHPYVQQLEGWRLKLRGVMRNAQSERSKAIYLDIEDEIYEGDRVNVNLVYRSYRQKVEDYISDNWSLPIIGRIRRLEKITAEDMKELEDILWNKLGTHADYDKENYEGSLAGFVRSLAGLDQEAVNEKFGKYLTGDVFNAKQQEFAKMVIQYVRENGEVTKDVIANDFPFSMLEPIQIFGDKMPILLAFVHELESIVPTAA